MAGNRVNIRGLVWAPLLKDTLTELVYDEIEPIIGAMTIGITPSIAGGDLFGDGVKREAEQALTGYDIAVELNKLPLKTRAAWQGHAIDAADGTLIEKATDKPIEFALGFIVDLTGADNLECVWFLKVGASPIANNMQQKTDNINYSTDNLTLKAKYRIFDDKIKIFGDTSAEGTKFTMEKAEAFFKTVPGDQSAL